jgi:DNA-binding response OmpR family regulator
MKTGQRGTIWVIGENKRSLLSQKSLLEKHFTVAIFQSISEFYNAFDGRSTSPHVLVLDSASQDSFVFESFAIPVVLLSDSDNIETLRKAYKSGLNEVCVKPFNENELIARLEKIVHQQISLGHVIQCDPITRKVSASGKTSAELTQRELQVFLAFQAANGHTLRRREVILQVWGNVQVGSKTLDVHLFNLRKKLAKTGLEIRFSSPDIFTLSIVEK